MEAITRQIQHYRLVISWKRDKESAESAESAVKDWVKEFNGWLNKLDLLLQQASGMAQNCAMSRHQVAPRDQMSEMITELTSNIVQRLDLISSLVDKARTEGIVANARHITPGWQTVTASSASTAQLTSDSQGVRDILAASTSSATITQAAGAPLATARMKLIDEPFIVGQKTALEDLEKRVINAEEAKFIGVHGKGGSGKTLLLKTLFNSEKVRKHFTEGFLLWLTVSKSPSFPTLRNKLWTQIAIQNNENNVGVVKSMNEQHVAIWIAVQNNVDLIKNVNEKDVEEALKEALQKSSLLIFDDVWKEDAEKLLKELGILQPVLDNSKSKVIVSSRDPETLLKMEIQIQIKDLNEHHSWKLFAQHAFPNNDRNPAGKEQGKLVCHMCQGLPLAIKVVGKAMAGSTDPKQWRWALQRLSNAESVYDCRLKFSFEALSNEGVKMQCCFLLVAAASLEDEILFARHVIMLWAGEGLLSDKMVQENDYDPFEKGWIYLSVLADRCLIEPMMRDHYGRVVCFRIHGELRDLAIQIAKEEENFYCPVGGESLVLNGNESSGCTRIFLRNKELSSLEQSPRAPEFCSLLISENRDLKIPGRVIGSMKSLKFLDLSGTAVQSLPKSLGNLKQLVCLRLLWMPIKILPASLTTLVNLEILDLSFSDITELPSRLHKLTSLRYLGLSHCKDLKYLPRSIVQLTSLQYLYMNECGSLWKNAERCYSKKVASISDLVHLTQLKWLELQNNGADLYENNDDKSSVRMPKMDTFRLTLTESKNLPSIMTEMPELKRLALKCPDLVNMEFVRSLDKKFDNFFQNLNYLVLFECGKLCKLPDLHKLNNLQRLEIIACRKLKEFPEGFGETGAFSSLKIFSLIRLEKLEKLPEIMEGQEGKQGAMHKLQIFTIMECPVLKTLPTGYLQQLKDLQKIRIYSCPVLAAQDYQNYENKNKMVKLMSIRDTEEIKKWHFQLCEKHGSWVYGEFWCNELFLFLGGLNTFV
jgi:DNA replication protein DnaC